MNFNRCINRLGEIRCHSPRQKNRIFFKHIHSPTFVHFKIVLVVVWHFCLYTLNFDDLTECKYTGINFPKYLNDVIIAKQLQVINRKNWRKSVICVRCVFQLGALCLVIN